MSEEERLTAYCGLYCGDCIPSQRELFATAARLQDLLGALQFEKYAELKAGQTYWSEANSAFKHYPEFLAVLQAIRGLECTATCREGGGWKGGRCKARNCAVENGLAGCWECAGYQGCEHLQPLLNFHPNLAQHLELIKSKGIGEWAAGRRAHYPW